MSAPASGVSRARFLAFVLLAASLSPALAASGGALPAGEPVVYAVGLADASVVAGADVFLGAQVLDVHEALRMARVLARDPATFEAAARAAPDVRYLERDEERVASASVASAEPVTPNDPRFAEQQNLRQVRAPEAWATTTGGDAARLCVIHSGLRMDHQEFAPGRVVAQHDFHNGDADASDDRGTGTLLTSVAAGGMNDGIGTAGVAQVPLLVAKAIGAEGTGAVSALAAALAWCADVGGPRTVVSASLSIPGGSSQAVIDAVDYATERGVLVVGTAGLNGPCGACVSFPANLPSVVAVGCTTSAEIRCDRSSQGPEVDVVEPGQFLLGAWHTAPDAYATLDDLTYSVAHTSGAAALLWSHAPNLTAAQVREALLSSAQDLGEAGHDDLHGCGEVDLGNLVSSVRTGCAPPECVSQAAGDCFAARQSFVPGGFWVSQSTVGATQEPFEPSICGLGASVWFTFRAEVNGTAQVSTYESEFNTALAVYQGPSVTSLESVDCDASPWGLGASVSFTCRAGEVYHIQAGGEGGAHGLLRLVQSGCGLDRLGTPTDVRVRADAPRELHLRWSPPFQTGGVALASYRVYAGDACDALSHVATRPASALYHEHTDRNLAGGALRCYRVSAMDVNGVEGPLSPPVTGIAEDRSTPPRELVAEPGAEGGVHLAWSPPASDGGTPLWAYHVYVSTGGEWEYASTVGPETTTYDDERTTLLALRYHVVAENRWGVSDPSNEACARPAPWPAAAPQLCELYPLQQWL